MTPDRRTFLAVAGAAAVAAGLRVRGVAGGPAPALIKPPRLRPGDTIGLIDPASATFEKVDVDIVTESLAALGFRVKPGVHLLDRHGYLAGADADRAADVNALFADPSVRAIHAVRGGWGCARMIPYLDYDLIRRNPKILLGYSDLTALLLAIHSKTGLVTFHGPVGVSKWNSFNVGHMTQVLVDGQAITLENVKEVGDNLTQIENRIRTITPGTARGRIVGGNLTVMTTIIGSGYLPDWDGVILFTEDVNEQIYRIDRMLTQLKLAGVLPRIRGFIFGNCTECDPGEGYGSLTLEEVLDEHIKPLGVPAWSGAMIGHIERQFTVPEGIDVEIDAAKGTIRMLEPAVV